MKRCVVICAVALLTAKASFASSGVAGIWATKTGDFVETEYPGTSTGLTDAIAYCSTGGQVRLCSGTFEINASLSLPSKFTLFGAGAGQTIIKLANSTNVDVISLSGDTDVTIRDLSIDGNKANNTTPKAGIRATTSTRVRLQNLDIYDCEQDGVYFSGNIDCTVIAVVSRSNLRNGFSCGDANGRSTRVRFIGCTSSGHTTSAAIGFSLEAASYSSVKGCVSDGDDRGITLLGGASDSSSYNVIEGNMLTGFIQSGIVVGPGPAGSSFNIVANNVLKPASTATTGISMTGTKDLTVSGNRMSSFGSSSSATGIYGDTLNSVGPKRFVIEGNVIQSPANYGILLGGATRGVISGNTVQNADIGEGNRDGIRLVDCLDITVVGNNVFDDQASATMNLGLQSTGTSDRVTVVGNSFRGGTQTAQLVLVGANNVVADNQGPPIPAVASAATITIPVHNDVATISGTTTITSVTASWVGRRVTLVFSGALTFTDGSNLKLAGNFVTTANDVISLVCDGTNWFEVSRAAN